MPKFQRRNSIFGNRTNLLYHARKHPQYECDDKKSVLDDETKSLAQDFIAIYAVGNRYNTSLKIQTLNTFSTDTSSFTDGDQTYL